MDGPSLDAVLPPLLRMNTTMEALAAIAVELAPEGPRPHPAIADAVAAVARVAGVAPELPTEARALASALVRSFFRQAAALIDHPDRAPGWTYEDPIVLEHQGRASAILAGILHALPPTAPLRDALARPGARMLDVGTGVGWLAIAMAQTFPQLAVVGLDREASVLASAHANVQRLGLGTRVELRHGDAAHITDDAGFDVAWLPGPFLDAASFDAVAMRTCAALRPGGMVVVGTYGDEDPLAAAVAQLRTLRSGGTAWTEATLTAALTRAGFVGAHALPKRWPAPVRLVVAQRRTVVEALR